MGSFKLKDPNATIDWSIDWSDWLDTGESISSDVWDITPSGTLTESTSSNTATVSTIYLTGGTVGETYQVTCRVLTDASTPRTDDRSITIRVGER